MISGIKSKYEENIISCKENFSYFYLELKIRHLPKESDFNIFKELILNINEEDEVKVNFIFSRDEEIRFIKGKDNKLIIDGTKYLVDESNNLKIIEDKLAGLLSEQDTKIILKINKNKNVSCMYIYDELTFINYLRELELKQILQIFNELLIKYKKINIKSNSNIYFKSNSISYNCDWERNPLLYLKEKEKKIKNRISINNTLGMDLYIIPCDFKIIYQANQDNNKISLKEEKILYSWITILNKIKDLLSIIYISDLVKVKDNNISITVSGYKEINIILNKESCRENKLLYDIYLWLYNGGNLVDKVLIARNVISLHCRYINIYDIDEDVLNSIKTNYKYYLKVNTEDFLEQRKDLKLIIIEESKKLSDALNDFLQNMLKNFMAYFVFIATLIITNSIENGEYTQIFSIEVRIILTLVIIGSIIYSILSYMVTLYRKYKFELYKEDLISAYGIYLGRKNVEDIIKNSNSYSKIEMKYNFISFSILILWLVINIGLLYVLHCII